VIELSGPNKSIVPFIACGDLSQYDSDKTYQLDDAADSLPPIQSPIAPPYKTACSLKQGLIQAMNNLSVANTTILEQNNPS
jgi:tRNA (cytidine32/guanosine34-2'-O)-methyltransferase